MIWVWIVGKVLPSALQVGEIDVMKVAVPKKMVSLLIHGIFIDLVGSEWSYGPRSWKTAFLATENVEAPCTYSFSNDRHSKNGIAAYCSTRS